MEGIIFQIVSVIFIVAAVVFYIIKNPRSEMKAKTVQRLMAIFQIIICGWFFALSLSDCCDYSVNFSVVRLVMDIFYDIAFLSVTIYVLFNNKKSGDAYFKGVIWACAALIGVQCFVYPYGSENELVRIAEAVEGIIVFTILVVFATNIRNLKFGRMGMLTVVILEFIEAISRTFNPTELITEEIEIIDIPLNYASLYMRPVLMASVFLAYYVWIDRHVKN